MGTGFTQRVRLKVEVEIEIRGDYATILEQEPPSLRDLEDRATSIIHHAMPMLQSVRVLRVEANASEV